MDNTEVEDVRLLNSNESNEFELVPQGTVQSVPTIYRCYEPHITESSSVPADPSGSTSSAQLSSGQPAHPSQQHKETPELELSLPRFGPCYEPDDDDMKFAKKKAWQHVIHKSGEDVKVTKQNFSAAIRKAEKEARKAYLPEVAGRRSKFRKMMIRDGCFFIQLAFMILGKPHLDLGYANTDLVFGAKSCKKDGEWLEAMFFPGNQIPLVVLEVLLEQKYFKDLLSANKGRWVPQGSDLRKTVLFKLLIQPKEINCLCRSNWLCSLANLRGAQIGGTELPKPSDVLHCLHTLVLGPAPADNQPGKYKARYDFDLEAGYTEDGLQQVTGDDQGIPSDVRQTAMVIRNFLNLIGMRNAMIENRRIFPSAQELGQTSIYIKKLCSGGARGICFVNYYIRGHLQLPVLTVNEDTEIVLRTLETYEMSNKQFGMYDREVCSYISFMNDILQTPHDLTHLQKIGIIKGPAEYVDRLPEVLHRLNSKGHKLTYNLRNVRRQITNFSSPLVRYQNIVNLVVILTVLQAIFAMLAYFKPPKQP